MSLLVIDPYRCDRCHAMLITGAAELDRLGKPWGWCHKCGYERPKGSIEALIDQARRLLDEPSVPVNPGRVD